MKPAADVATDVLIEEWNRRRRARLARKEVAASADAGPGRTEELEGWDDERIWRALELRRSAIYVRDDRAEIEMQAPAIQIAARSVLAVFPSLTRTDQGDYLAPQQTLGAWLQAKYRAPAHWDEPFTDQPVGAAGTAFLVEQDLVATAGHVATRRNVASLYFVLDFRLHMGKAPARFPAENVYRAQEIVSRPDDGPDYAVVRLSETVRDRDPLNLRRTGKIADGAQVYALGHPAGLPAKISPNGSVVSNRDLQEFLATVDAYDSSSGSPVLSASDHLVEGLLYDGRQDFKVVTDPDTGREYVRSFVIERPGRSGEACVRATQIRW